jgi:exodeoxyribonuclease V alpha subunit
MQEDDFEAAYAITVHKSQGSEFHDVFVVIPERRALLSRELVYTAMTRSTGPLSVFVQRSARENPLAVARQRSDLLRRNSSLLTNPLDAHKAYEPEQGTYVKSKIEYLIHEMLRQQREAGSLLFQYEKPPLTLTLDGKPTAVHPDFTITVGGRIYYWEHLGMLDRYDYYQDWCKRRAAYEAAGLSDSLVTTDDLQGIHQDRITKVIEDILQGTLEQTPGNEFSNHDYAL